jgi:hypothetical protein
VAYPGIFFRGGGVPQIQLRAADIENGDLGSVALLNLQMSETRILIRLLRMYFSWNREISSALSKLRNFGTPLGYTELKFCYRVSYTEYLKVPVVALFTSFPRHDLWSQVSRLNG